ncbi:HNH endonuclease (plasmid) [Piscirickettsia salmonis]|uniref:HNH endonuclease n=1 Tax=Piscirickettsia salmonis TaxID=1238 RepID=A0AAC8ZQA4_PISSA|nr:HNH endonuclease [Piscirickettsia salmonis]
MPDVITQRMHVIANTTNNTVIDTMPHARQLPSVVTGGGGNVNVRYFYKIIRCVSSA